MYIVKYDSIGNLQWIRQYGTAGLNDDAGGVDTDSAGNVFVTGGIQEQLAGGLLDVFLMKLDPDGSVHYITENGGSGDWERGVDVGVDSSDNVYIGGNTTGSFFGAHNGIWDLFIFKSAEVCP